MAANDPVFHPANCTVPPITPIPPCERLLADDTVSDPPPAIPDCPDEVITLPVEPPCPDIKPTAAAPKSGIKYGGTAATNPPHLTYAFTRGNCCDFDLTIDLNVPCPTIGPDAQTVVPTWTAGPGSVVFGFVKDLTSCDFAFEIEVAVHCPQLTPGTTVVKPIPFVPGVGTLTYKFTKGVDCDWDLDIDVDVPCPTLTPGVPVVKHSGASTLTYAFTKGINCDWDLDIDFAININFPCPVLTPNTRTTVPTWTAGPGSVVFGFVKTPDVCDFDLDIEVAVHCPQVAPLDTAPTTKSFALGAGTLTYGFAKGIGCDWELDIDIGFDAHVSVSAGTGCVDLSPVAQRTVPVNFAAGSPGALAYRFGKGVGCVYDLVATLDAPCPPITPQTTTTKPVAFVTGTAGSLAYGFTKSAGCTYALDIVVNVPCPDIEPQATVTKPVTFVVGTAGTLGYGFSRGANCDYTLAVDLNVPSPDIEPTTPTTSLVNFAAGAQGTVTYAFTRTGASVYTLAIAAAAPCPDIQPQVATRAYSTYGLVPYIEYGFTKAANCSYTLSLSSVVACPDVQPLAPTYANLYKAGGVQGAVRYYFTRIGCDYDLVLEAALPCPVVDPQVPTYVYFYTANGVQAYLRYYFVKGPDCDYTLSITGAFPPPVATAAGGFWARITGRSGTRYAFVEVAVDEFNLQVDVPGGITGTTAVGYAQDIDSFTSDILYDPDEDTAPVNNSDSVSESDSILNRNNQKFFLTPNPEVPGCWLFKAVYSAGIWAKITGRTGTQYDFVEVGINAFDQVFDISGGYYSIPGIRYAQDVLLRTSDSLIGQTLYLLPNAEVPGCWLFNGVKRGTFFCRITGGNEITAYYGEEVDYDAGTANWVAVPGGVVFSAAGRRAPTGDSTALTSLQLGVVVLAEESVLSPGQYKLMAWNGNGIYAKITGRAGTKYAFTQYTVNNYGEPVVLGPVTGTTAVGYVQDIAGFSNDGLINKFAWITPNTVIPGTWIMGPWRTYTNRIVTSVTCTAIGNVQLNYLDTPIYYIGG